MRSALRYNWIAFGGFVASTAVIYFTQRSGKPYEATGTIGALNN